MVAPNRLSATTAGAVRYDVWVAKEGARSSAPHTDPVQLATLCGECRLSSLSTEGAAQGPPILCSTVP